MRILSVLLLLVFSASAVANSTGAWYDPEQDGHGISLFDIPAGQVFWWFTYHPEFGQTWLMSSVETGTDFVVYRPLASDFPTAADFRVGEPLGTVQLLDLADGTKLMRWDLLVEAQTCESLYGPVPPGPRDPRCLDEDRNFIPDRVLQEGFDEVGEASLIRLTPAIQ